MNAEGICYQDETGHVRQIEPAKIRLARMPESTFYTHRLSMLNPRPELEGLETAIKTVRQLVMDELPKPLALFYSATPGLGKTHLAYAAGWMMLGAGKSVSFYKTADLLDELRGGYRISENYRADQMAGGTLWTYEQIMRRVQTVHFLILDDIGLQKMTDWSVEKLDQIVDYRYDNNKATLLTANGLEFSQRIVSRCKEGALVRLKGTDYRGTK